MLTDIHRIRSFVLAAALTAPAHIGQNLITVGPSSGPGIDYTNLQTAIFAASDGSTILLKHGSYSGFFASQKSLRIVADAGATVRVTSPSIVLHIGASKSFSIKGVDFSSLSARPLWIANCDGSVWVEDTEIDQSGQNSLEAVSVVDCPDVTFVGARITSPVGRIGMRVDSEDDPTNVHLFDCEITGGSGNPAQLGGLEHGKAAVHVQNAGLYMSGSTLRGGKGVYVFDDFFGCIQSKGGPGLSMNSETSPVTVGLLDSQLIGGSGATGCGAPPIDGVPFEGTGQILPLPGARRSFTTNAPVREGQSLALSFGGSPGEYALAALGAPDQTATGLLAWNSWKAPLLVEAGALLVPVGTLPAGGTLALALPIGELGVDAFTLHAQSVFVDLAAQSVRAGPVAQITLLDAAE
ncbi:MAG: hypothetical protein FJ299_07395 [Planctomycetes bacterium]|nr:hypothetical protein [Planctomycetota bacterium]